MTVQPLGGASSRLQDVAGLGAAHVDRADVPALPLGAAKGAAGGDGGPVLVPAEDLLELLVAFDHLLRWCREQEGRRCFVCIQMWSRR